MNSAPLSTHALKKTPVKDLISTHYWCSMQLSLIKRVTKSTSRRTSCQDCLHSSRGSSLSWQRTVTNSFRESNTMEVNRLRRSNTKSLTLIAAVIKDHNKQLLQIHNRLQIKQDQNKMCQIRLCQLIQRLQMTTKMIYLAT